VAAAHQSVVAAHDGDLVLAVRAVEPVLVALGEELVVAVVALRRNDTLSRICRGSLARRA